MLLAQASNHLVSTIFYSAEPSTFYGCWLLKKLLLLILTKIRIVRVKKNTAISCQCCVVVLDVCCWWSEPPTSENRVSMLDTMPASDDRYDSHCAEYLLYISLQLYFLANTRAMHCTGAPPPTHFNLKNVAKIGIEKKYMSGCGLVDFHKGPQIVWHKYAVKKGAKMGKKWKKLLRNTLKFKSWDWD